MFGVSNVQSFLKQTLRICRILSSLSVRPAKAGNTYDAYLRFKLCGQVQRSLRSLVYQTIADTLTPRTRM